MMGAALLAFDHLGGGCPVSGRLVVCPTPIGNLEDVTLRVLSALRDADVVACEDTRRTRILLDRYGVKAKLVSYHEHNERARSAELVGRMREGAVVALVSDAGMPLVSDPGYLLVRGCVAAGLPVEVLPGPSAAITALVASGLPADEWRFHGFLPRKKGELRRELAEPGGTLVAFESPRRVPATLALLAEIDPAREVAVCRGASLVHASSSSTTFRRPWLGMHRDPWPEDLRSAPISTPASVARGLNDLARPDLPLPTRCPARSTTRANWYFRRALRSPKVVPFERGSETSGHLDGRHVHLDDRLVEVDVSRWLPARRRRSWR